MGSFLAFNFVEEEEGMGRVLVQVLLKIGGWLGFLTRNAIAFGNALRREADSQPISELAIPAVSRTTTHNLGFLSVAKGKCLPGARPARYFSINYPDFGPRYTLSWKSPLSRPHCTAHLPYKARGIVKQYL